jgi:hydrogenase maturation protease
MRTLILGLGNAILTDDAVGVRVAEAVSAALAARPSPGAEVATAAVGGLALMELLIGYERAILVDAVVRPDLRPGRVLRLTLDDLRAMQATERSVSPHDTSLCVALDLGRKLGLPLPEAIVIYAVTVSELHDFGEEPTPPVAAAIPAAADAVLAELLWPAALNPNAADLAAAVACGFP